MSSSNQTQQPTPAKQAQSQQAPPLSVLFNVPNQLTSLRFLLAILVFVLMDFHCYVASTIVFVIAASTDWLDGYWARKYGQVTTVGRVFDPFVDKFIICGTFIYLAATPGSGMVAWMAVMVVGREMLVTALRGFMEQNGIDFSAKMPGKLKMVFQCFAAGFALYGLSFANDAIADPLDPYQFGLSLINNDQWQRPLWLNWSLLVSLWLAIIFTIYSGVGYIASAAKYLFAKPK